jgi:hypothetical protein
LREFTFFHQVVDMRTLEAGFPLHFVTPHDVTFGWWLRVVSERDG